jgi:hypothetical protein
MKKYIIILIIVAMILSTSCNMTPPIIEQKPYNCSEHRYISYETANQLINITNRLITINNICISGTNLTKLSYIGYFSEN